MNDAAARPAIQKIRELVSEHAAMERHLPEELAVKILEHEHAVQFDEKRYEAGSYIRGLVNEMLDHEQEARDAH
jgi:hypothetical protein